jgi:hypothetical protein
MQFKSLRSEATSSAFFRLLDRHFLLITGLLLAILALSQLGSAIQETPTNDEPVHLTAGYVYLTRGEYQMELSAPPLARVLTALPLLAWPPRLRPSGNLWHILGTVLWDDPPSTVLLHARMVVIALTLLFGAWLSWWTRREFGVAVALLALFFFVFDPNLLAHGHYATTDLCVSFGIFLACTLWTDFLQAPGWEALGLAVGGIAFALLSKYSALFLIVALPLMYGVAWWRKRGRPFFTSRYAIAVVLATILGVTSCIALAYAPAAIVRARSSWTAPGSSPVATVATPPKVRSTISVRRFFAEFRSAISPGSFRYIQGLNQVRKHNTDGQAAYLLGQFGSRGWWEYFPVVFMVKTPTGVLLACLLAAASLFYFRKETSPVLPLVCVTLPPALFFLAAMSSSIDLGVRYILPIYAFLYVFVSFMLVSYGRGLLGRTWPYAIALLLILTCSESLLSYPHYLAFFNWPSGGSASGASYLLDSNLDWAQDTDNLRRYVERTGSTPVCTALFAYTPKDYFGPGWRDLLATGVPEGFENLNCVVAVSVNFVKGLYIGPKAFAALRRLKPFAEIGYSIYLYDFRHRRAGNPRTGSES